jgi:hypothetical protein
MTQPFTMTSNTRPFIDVAKFMHVMGLAINTKVDLIHVGHWPTMVFDPVEGEPAELLEAWNKLQRLTEQLRWQPIISDADWQAYGEAWALVLDGIIDSIYVLIGFAHALGLPLEEGWRVVQSTNMAKFVDCKTCYGKGRINRPGDRDLSGEDRTVECIPCAGTGKVVLRREDGKVLKPEGWIPPEPKLLALIMPLLRPQVNERFAALPVVPPVVKP